MKYCLNKEVILTANCSVHGDVAAYLASRLPLIVMKQLFFCSMHFDNEPTYEPLIGRNHLCRPDHLAACIMTFEELLQYFCNFCLTCSSETIHAFADGQVET